MPLYMFYTMVQKSQKMTKNSNQGGPALNLAIWELFRLKVPVGESLNNKNTRHN